MGYNEKIRALRDDINAIDKQMIQLFEQRMHTASEVAAAKKQYGKPIFDASRENTVIARAISQLTDASLREETKYFFHALMDISKKRQQLKMGDTPPSADYFADKTDARLGYLGIPGSYSHIAAAMAHSTASLKNYPSFSAIFAAMQLGEVDYAVLPAENTETGSITAVVDLLAKYGYFIVGEKLLPVSHSLLALPGTHIDDIQVVYSHPEALSQCSVFLGANPSIVARSSLSTAQAAVTVKEQGNPSIACIASQQAGDIYSLDALQTDIQNSLGNRTRFVVIGHQPYKSERCDKTSIALMLAHKPGSLYEMLGVFAQGGINILKLESRPLKDRPFEYLFHLDFEGSVYDGDVAKTIEIVRQKAAGYTYLGSYPREQI